MNKKTKKIENVSDEIYEILKSVREETTKHLGDEDANQIIRFHSNNWTDITHWIFSNYNFKEEQMNVVSFQYSRLFKELYWLHILFHNGNYPMVYRNLRYILEMICQAYYVDSKYPDLFLDGQLEKMKEIEEKVYGWRLVETVLCEILDRNNQQIQSNFKPLWNHLNKHVHPSGKQMDIVALEDIESLMRDSFNENLARDALRTTDEIFDIVKMIIFKKFPKIKEEGLKYKFRDKWEQYLPNTMKIIKSKNS